MSGIVGRFMASFGLTMAFAIMISLFVSFTLTPSLAARWFKPVNHAPGPVENPAGGHNAQIAATDGTASTQHGAGHGSHSAASHGASHGSSNHTSSRERGFFAVID